MTTLSVGIASFTDLKADILSADRQASAGHAVDAAPALYFGSYDDMHRVLAPARLAIVKAMAGHGPLAIREVARRVGRDVQAVHRDITTLINAGVIDRSEAGVTFPYEEIQFDFKIRTAA